MSLFHHSSSPPIPLYRSEQVYALEQTWFAAGHDSFGLMQQAAWQMAYWLHYRLPLGRLCNAPIAQTASIWVGQGNNGGDGWLLACYLQQLGWQVKVIDVAQIDEADSTAASDGVKAKAIALAAGIQIQVFSAEMTLPDTQVMVDALFGIGLHRQPEGRWAQAISAFNRQAQLSKVVTVAVDVPSGLVASTGQVFADTAVRADVTLCLVARKIGLHIKDGSDYAGIVVDLPLIPLPNEITATAQIISSPETLIKRSHNSHKGSFGHVLLVGGGYVAGYQGMGGATILSAQAAFAVGAGKVTVACAKEFHGALLAAAPNAMCIDSSVEIGLAAAISRADVVAIGMGLGRDEQAFDLFCQSLSMTMQHSKSLLIDADGLYHLATLADSKPSLFVQWLAYAQQCQRDDSQRAVYLTPHTAEMARLLGIDSDAVEADRLAAIQQAATEYGGDWLLKGAGSLVYEQQQLWVCAVGNAGMATAGMGDVLSGVAAGLLAQSSLSSSSKSLRQAVLLHGMAGDRLAQQAGVWGLQAQHMPAAISGVMAGLTL